MSSGVSFTTLLLPLSLEHPDEQPLHELQDQQGHDGADVDAYSSTPDGGMMRRNSPR